MKQLIFMLLALVALTSCKKEVPNLDPYARLALNASTVAPKATPAAPYSMETVVRYAFETMFWYDDSAYPDRPARQAIPEHDLTNLKFWIGEAQSVIYVDKSGTPQLGWLANSNLRDLVVVAIYGEKDPTSWIDAYKYFDLTERPDSPKYKHYDTIGYVPNRVIKAAEAEIHKAFNAGDYEKCTQLFETAYVFQPITGAEWRALKAKNEQ